jgi:NAD(P)-dependent dehydrogenase (short-subunit alcohol dehydrogenase family)
VGDPGRTAHLRAQGAGHIIQLSSAAGLIAMPLGGAYQVSKWAVEALNETLAQEVAEFGIEVTGGGASWLRHQVGQEP